MVLYIGPSLMLPNEDKDSSTDDDAEDEEVG